MQLMLAGLSLVISALKSFVSSFFILIIFASLVRHLLCFYTLIKRQLEHIRASTVFNATLGTTDADLRIDSASQRRYFDVAKFGIQFELVSDKKKKKKFINFFF